jgi:phosphonate transport system ATP-binding protein
MNTTIERDLIKNKSKGVVHSLFEKKQTAIAVSNIFKQYNRNSPVLKDISFEIPNEQSVALVGSNGSGKSTLLRCCIRLVEPDKGKIKIYNNDISQLSVSKLRSVRSTIGFIFQRHNLVPRLSVLSNVIHGAQSRKKGIRVWYQCFATTEDREEAMCCLDRVGCAHLADRRVDQLSGGESQRVAIARALMQRPKIMMADEPAASLDPAAGREVMDLFIRLKETEKITLIFVSHNLEHALSYSERILGLRNCQLNLDSLTHSESLLSLRGLYE